MRLTGPSPATAGPRSCSRASERNVVNCAVSVPSTSQSVCSRRTSVSQWSVNPAETALMHKGKRASTITAAVELDDEDLLQFPDRLKWYEAKFCADDMPDWNAAKFVSSCEVAPGLRALTLQVEISRERVPLRCAYKTVGQKASIRLVGGEEHHLSVATPPFPQDLNRHPLFMVRGDLFAYEIKAVREPISVMAEMDVLVGEREAPELYHMEEDAILEVVMFVTGKGIATARALLEASTDVPGINIGMRKTIKAYYKVRNSAGIIFKERFPEWSAAAAAGPRSCRLDVVPTTEATFQRAFDDDDELMYDPEYTAAIILTGGDEEAEKEARAVCKEAEIKTVLSDSQEAAELVHLDSTPTAFRRWIKDRAN